MKHGLLALLLSACSATHPGVFEPEPEGDTVINVNVYLDHDAGSDSGAPDASFSPWEPGSPGQAVCYRFEQTGDCVSLWTDCHDGHEYSVSCGPEGCGCEIDGEQVVALLYGGPCPDRAGTANTLCGWMLDTQ